MEILTEMTAPLLSLVVIAFDMPREIPRTLYSLSPNHQRGIARDDYEVVLVDNGSRRPFNREECGNLGVPLRVRYLEPGDPSPVRAINTGISMARGELIGVMIDGARLASPGLLYHATAAARIHPRAVIATLGFHLGHELQMTAVTKGYDQRAEDDLLASSGWTEDGYALFDIAVLAGSSAGGWFRPLAESNALFLPRELWQELDGFDDRFRCPGGGLANLDTYRRACLLPDSQLIVLLGEGTFHQVHGGIATNSPQSRWDEFHAEYREIRGEDFEPPGVRPWYLGDVAPQVLPSIASSASSKS